MRSVWRSAYVTALITMWCCHVGGAALELVEAKFGFKALVMLFDCPAVNAPAHKLRERGRASPRHQVVFDATRRSQAAFAGSIRRTPGVDVANP
jgi:hypothetical protein